MRYVFVVVLMLLATPATGAWLSNFKVADQPSINKTSYRLNACLMYRLKCVTEPIVFMSWKNELLDSEGQTLAPKLASVWVRQEDGRKKAVRAWWTDTTTGLDGPLSNAVVMDPPILVPEPGYWLLFASGLLALPLLYWHRHRKKPSRLAGEWEGKYMHPDAIVTDIRAAMTAEARELWLKVENEHDLIGAHHTTGRSIRNWYGLWDETNPHTDITDSNSPNHPDEVSMYIIREIWKQVQS